MLPTTTVGSLPVRLSYGAALIFTLASTGTNLIYGWSKGADLPGSVVWAAVSVGVSIVFALSWPALIRALDDRQWSRALIVFCALLLTGTYSVSAALGSAMGGRTNAAAEEKSIVDARGKAQAAYERARLELDPIAPARPATELQALIQTASDELAALAPARPPAELTALIEGVKLNPRSADCVAIGGSIKMRCPKLAEWRAEKARAEQRQKLSANMENWTDEKARAEQRQKLKADLDKASADLAELPAAKLANSDAVALASYLSALGVETTADRVNKLLVLLAVLVIECGGGLAMAVGMSLTAPERSGTPLRDQRPDKAGDIPRTASQAPAAPPMAPGGTAVALPVRPAVLPPARDQSAPCGTSEKRFLELLRDRGGHLLAGQRTLADALGISKTQVNRLLRNLSDAGRVAVNPGHRGTAIRLVEAVS